MEGDGAEVVQQVRVFDLSPERDNSESEKSVEAAARHYVQRTIDPLRQVLYDTRLDVKRAIGQLEKAFDRVEPQRGIEDFMQEVRLGTTDRLWTVRRIRRTVVDVILARAIASGRLEDYEAMETHVENAIKYASLLSETQLYGSLQKRWQYMMGVALYYQQCFPGATDAFEKAENCPAAPGISLRDAKEWRHVIKEALPVPQKSSFPEQREDVSDSDTTPTQERWTSVLALFPSSKPSRKLSNIDEELEAGESNNYSAVSTPVRRFEEALPSPLYTPLTPSSATRFSRPNILQRKKSLKESASVRPNLLRNVSIRSQFALAFESSRSRAGSMNEGEINAAFGGGGEYQTHPNTPAAFETPRESWASGYEREEITLGDDDLRKQRWAEWDKWIRSEDELFKEDEIRFKTKMRTKYEEQMKESEGVEDESMTPTKELKMDPEAKRKDLEAKKEERLRRMREKMTPKKQEKNLGAKKKEMLRIRTEGMTPSGDPRKFGQGSRRNTLTMSEDRRGAGSVRPRRHSLLRDEV